MDSSDADITERDPLVRTVSEPSGSKTDAYKNKLKMTSSTAQESAWTPKQRPNLPPGTSLASLFRYHMGIDHDEMLVPQHLASKSAIDPIATGKNQGRRAVNLGIYNRCIREERGTALSYQVWSIVINGALGAQIVFAAALTALGAGDGDHRIVAILGTMNTVIAGFLTYLKGTGLPMRMKYFHNQWLKLRAYIEQRERDFASDDISQIHHFGYAELMEEVDIIEKMYHNIRKDIEKHTPEAFGGKNDNSASEAPGEGAPEASLAARGLNAVKAKISGNNFAEDLENRLTRKSSAKQTSQYGGTDAQSKSRSDSKPALLDSLDEEDSEDDDVTKMAMARMRELQERSQKQADARVKELEEQLAALKKSGTPEN